MTAAAFVSIFLLIRSEMNLPKNTAKTETKVSAIIVPHNTSGGLYFVAKIAAEICVLSPHSVSPMRIKPERNALL